MSSRKFPSNDPADNFIGRSLKHWLWDQDPPEDAKEKLLKTAYQYSIGSSEKIRFWRLFSKNIFPSFDTLFSMFNEGGFSSNKFVETSLTEPSMQRIMANREKVFRTFPTRMAFYCLIS